VNISVNSTVNAKAILGRKGLGPGGKLRKYLAARVKLHCDPYVPMRSGTLKNTAQISSDGSELVYNQPYAHYQYHGMAMAGRAPKHYTGKPLRHNGAPMRGPHWEKRMLADHVHDLEQEVAAFINSNGGKS
jgi:Minor capsid.